MCVCTDYIPASINGPFTSVNSKSDCVNTSPESVEWMYDTVTKECYAYSLYYCKRQVAAANSKSI